MTFSKTENFGRIFSINLFHTQYKCLDIVKREEADFVTNAGMVNAQCEAFKLKELSGDIFKCLILVQGLTAPKDKEIRSRILTIMEQDPNIALQKVTEECQRLINIKNKTRFEKSIFFRVQTVRQQKRINSKENLYAVRIEDSI